MKNTFFALSFLLLSGISLQVFSQDTHSSQFYENAAMRNPALVGIFTGDYRIGVNYRTQWSSLAIPFQTTMLTSEYAFKPGKESRDFISVGLTALYDKAGEISFNSFQVMPSVNYSKAIDDDHNSFMSAGFGLGYIQRSFNPANMTFNNQYSNGAYDPAASSGESFPVTKVQQFDFNAGVSFNSSLGTRNRLNYYIGAGAYHITRPEESFLSENSLINLPSRFTGQLGVDFRASDNVGVTFYMNYTNQHPYQEWIGGGLLRWGQRDANDRRKNFTVYGGVFYRFGDAVIPTFKFQHRGYYVVLSYDVTTSSLGQLNNRAGSFEVSLFSLFTRASTRRAVDQTQCPRFELLMNENSGF